MGPRCTVVTRIVDSKCCVAAPCSARCFRRRVRRLQPRQEDIWSELSVIKDLCPCSLLVLIPTREATLISTRMLSGLTVYSVSVVWNHLVRMLRMFVGYLDQDSGNFMAFGFERSRFFFYSDNAKRRKLLGY